MSVSDGRTSILRRSASFLILAGLSMLAGCERREPFVYVLESPQVVVLKASSSASKVQQGETVVLNVERRTLGKWKQISRNQLTYGQCWVYQPPVEIEEVAHSVEWAVTPTGAVEFQTEYRLDDTRAVKMIAKGQVMFTPISTVKCEQDRRVTGSPVKIEVS